jgi:hypothetical protein
MKQARSVLASCAAAALVLACADASELGAGSERDPAEQEETSEAEPEQAEPEGAEPEEPEGDAPDDLEVDEEAANGEAWQFVEAFDDPFVWEEGGVRLSITGIGINDAAHPDVPSDVAEFLDDGVETIVVLEMTASNDSGQTINFYPDQGTIQLLREQVEPDFLFTDSIAGYEWRDGVDDDGQVFWMLMNTSFDDAVAAGELTFVTGAPHDSESWDDIAGPVEMQVTWTP